MRALIVVDMQYDFINGSLAVPGAAEIVFPIQELVRSYCKNRDVVILTRDRHPVDHCSFVEQGGFWPAHCVAGTEGGKIQLGLRLIAGIYNAFVVSKGKNPDEDEYSGFKYCLPILREEGVDDVQICGLARDYCVQATYEESVKVYPTTILEDLCRSVNK